MVYVEDIQTDETNVHVYKSNTLKIDTPCGVPLMKFGATDEEIAELQAGASLNAVCRANANEFNWEINPQLMIEDMEIIPPDLSNPIAAWGF